MTCLRVVPGDQLFPLTHLPPPGEVDYLLAEDYQLCTNVAHHQQKIVIFLSAMRSYRDALRDRGDTVHYRQLDTAEVQQQSYETFLSDIIQQHGYTEIVVAQVSDVAFAERLRQVAETCQVSFQQVPNPAFCTPYQELIQFLQQRKQLKLHDFYIWQRKRMKLLLVEDGDEGKSQEPMGGKWSFDSDNRQALPKSVTPPDPLIHQQTDHTTDAISLVQQLFASHPGSLEQFNWPTTHQQAALQLQQFCEVCLDDFGPYQDALTDRSATVFHSLLSPAMNCGLLTADQVIEAVVRRLPEAHYSSVEGFVRQVVGWREFIFGVHHVHHRHQWHENFFNHQGKLAACWWDGTTGLAPLDYMVHKCHRIGYAHHIERLMVAGNVMVLAGVHPHEAYRWFMELFVDSAEWVMGPNVFGMALFSDGGLFATKPYICASSYWRKQGMKMSPEASDGLDGLYWQFIERHEDMLAANHRTRRMTWGLNRLKAERKAKIYAAADKLREHLIHQ